MKDFDVDHYVERYDDVPPRHRRLRDDVQFVLCAGLIVCGMAACGLLSLWLLGFLLVVLAG